MSGEGLGMGGEFGGVDGGDGEVGGDVDVCIED